MSTPGVFRLAGSSLGVAVSQLTQCNLGLKFRLKIYLQDQVGLGDSMEIREVASLVVAVWYSQSSLTPGKGTEAVDRLCSDAMQASCSSE